MLGRTAKWLRLLGFDAFYDNKAADAALKKLCLEEQRILLTKDMALHESMPAGSSRPPRPTRSSLGMNRARANPCSARLSSSARLLLRRARERPRPRAMACWRLRLSRGCAAAATGGTEASGSGGCSAKAAALCSSSGIRQKQRRRRRRKPSNRNLPVP